MVARALEGAARGAAARPLRRGRRAVAKEQGLIEAFVADLPAVRRALAQVPVAMIFDDHDVTDDWNLSREWEEVAYGHPFSRRVIGNAIVAYAINQAWGNRPDAFDDALFEQLQRSLDAPGAQAHDDCIDALLRFEDWHYTWPTTPPLVVIDTRTRRWRSERTARRPSGLMDWESLTDLQQVLRGLPAVLLVSPAPIFGVKLIETLQRIFTWFGHPLMVDAENWMAHPGSAQAILNIFRHRRTPRNFVVLSGDVHYSFVYDVELRGRVRGPDIWQICSSGVRNEFPPRLLGGARPPQPLDVFAALAAQLVHPAPPHARHPAPLRGRRARPPPARRRRHRPGGTRRRGRALAHPRAARRRCDDRLRARRGRLALGLRAAAPASDRRLRGPHSTACSSHTPAGGVLRHTTTRRCQRSWRGTANGARGW